MKHKGVHLVEFTYDGVIIEFAIPDSVYEKDNTIPLIQDELPWLSTFHVGQKYAIINANLSLKLVSEYENHKMFEVELLDDQTHTIELEDKTSYLKSYSY